MSILSNIPVLSMIVWLPLLGVVAILFLPKTSVKAVQGVALGCTSLSFVLCWSLLFAFDRNTTDLQFTERLEWIPDLGMTYALGLDGLSFPLLLLTSLISLSAVVASLTLIRERVKGYFAWFLLLEFAVLGVFVAQDWFLFYVFYEVGLVPMFFLIGLWGGARKDAAAMSFFLYTLVGSIFMLLGIIAVYLNSDPGTFDMRELLESRDGWTQTFQTGAFLAFLAGFAVKIPIFPLHGWLPLAHVEAPTPVSMLLSGLLLKMGAYGLMRAGELLPLGLEWFAPILLALGFINILYGALLAWRQTDLKSIVAFSSIDHMGFVLVGIASLNALGFTGAVMMMVTHGIISAGLFFLVGVIYDRAHTRDMTEFSGLMSSVPIFSILLSLSFLASMGLPGLAQFVSEFHVLVGGFQQWGLWVIVALIGVLLTAAYSLRTIGRMVMGETDPRWVNLKDVGGSELAVIAPLAALMIVLGVYPGVALGIMTSTMAQMAALFG
ncbi:MAG: complex I subunit 4 family protein [Rubrobacteraceae bacterium]